MERFSFRTPTAADAEAIVTTAAEGVALYRSFAPPGWTPPLDPPQLAARRIADPTLWWLLAEASDRVAGHVAFMPAAKHARPDPDPRLAHLGALFVRRAHHGTGLARELLSRAGAEALAQGFDRGRLFAAAGYDRGQRFYAREGWRPAGEPFPEPAYGGLLLLEHRRECGGVPTTRPSLRRPSS